VQQRDHHDWTSEAYVEAWVTRQQTADPIRTMQFQLLCDLLPFSTDAQVTILDVGAGYGPVSKFILDQFPNATCIAQDGSAPMLQHARQLMAGYSIRFIPFQSDLFDTAWVPSQFGPFDAVVSSFCLHNLRDFTRIREIYGDIRAHLKPDAAFLNLDLLSAPTPGLQQHYDRVVATRRQREGATRNDLDALVQRADQSPTHASAHAFPGSLDQHLAALRAAGFLEVDCFWKDVQRALFGGYA
jgi:tRNA (cmo5U34)-methyltransferase